MFPIERFNISVCQQRPPHVHGRIPPNWADVLWYSAAFIYRYFFHLDKIRELMVPPAVTNSPQRAENAPWQLTSFTINWGVHDKDQDRMKSCYTVILRHVDEVAAGYEDVPAGGLILSSSQS